MEQFPERNNRLVGLHSPCLVYRDVAEVLYDPCLRNQRVADKRPERRFMDACCKRGLVGVFQTAVAFVEPPDRYLERKPGVKTYRMK
jgi:hypothetical protein